MNPYPYQREGIEWLAARRNALLADEMGLGKSAQVVWAAVKIGAQDVLVLCPALARRVWEYEWRANSDLRVSLMTERADEPGITGVTVCSYSLAGEGASNGISFIDTDDAAPQSIIEKLASLPWDLVVVDESHYLKALTSGRSQAVYKHLLPRAKRVWALSGTPAPNHPGEMHAITYYLFPEAIADFRDKSEWAFFRRYCHGYVDGYGNFRAKGGKNLADLRRRLAPHVLRRRKKDVLKDLPPISYHHLPVDPGRIEYRALFDPAQFGDASEVQQRIAEEADVIRRILAAAPNQGAVLPALASIAPTLVTLRRWIGMAKIDAVVEWIEKWTQDTGEKVVLFGWHRDVLRLYRDILSEKKLKPVLLYGGTDEKDRRRGLKKFADNPRCRVFIGQIHTAGTAITLTNACTVVFAEMDWVPGNNAQAAMRCHRIGQKNPVSVYVASLAGTVDVQLNRVLREKTRVLTELFD